MSRKTLGVKGDKPVLPGNWGSRYTIPRPHEMDKGKPEIKTNCKYCIHNDQKKCKLKYKEEAKAGNCPQYMRSDLYPSIMDILNEEEQINTNRKALNNSDGKNNITKSKNKQKQKNIRITFSEYVKEKLDSQINLLREASIDQKEVSKKLFADRQKSEDLLERFVLLCLYKRINPSSVLIRSYIFNYLSLFLIMGEDSYREKYSNIQTRLNLSKEKLDIIKGGLKLIQADWNDLNVEKFYNSNYLNAKEEILKTFIRSLDDYEYEELITSEEWKNNKPLLRERALAQWTGEIKYYGTTFRLDDWEYLYDFIEESSEYSKFPFIKEIMEKGDHEFDKRIYRGITSPETYLEVFLYIDKYGEVNAQVEIILNFYNCAIGDIETDYGIVADRFVVISEIFKKGVIFDILWERYIDSINITDTKIILKKLVGSQNDNEIDSNELETDCPIDHQRFLNQSQIRIEREINQLKTYSSPVKIEAMMIYKDKRDSDILNRFILLCLEKFKDYGLILNCLEYYNQLELYVSFGDSLYLSIFSKYIDNIYDSDYLIGIVDIGIKMIGCTWGDILYISQKEDNYIESNQLSQETVEPNLFSLRRSQILFNIIFRMMEMTQIITVLDKDSSISLNDNYIEVVRLSMSSNDLLTNPESLEIVEKLKKIKNQITARLCIEPLTNELFIDFTAKVKCIFPNNMNQNNEREDVIVLHEKITQNQYLEKEWENFLRVLKEKVRNQEDRECLI